MPQFLDRVRDTTTTTGTGDVTPAGAPPTGFQAWTAFSAGDWPYYVIADQSGANWEVGQAPWTGSVLQRSSSDAKVFASSNSGALVNFGAGTKDLWCDIPAFWVQAADMRGADVLIGNGMCLP